MSDDAGLPPYVSGRPTSQAAAMSHVDSHRSQLERVWSWGNHRGPRGWTDEECELASGRRHQSISARRRRLYQLRRVIWTGRKRLNESNRKACVWVTDEVSRAHSITPIPLPINNADRLAWLEMYCQIQGPSGDVITTRKELDRAIKLFYSRSH